MRKIVLSVGIILSAAGTLQAQSGGSVDHRIEEVYGTYLSEVTSRDPQRIEELNNLLGRIEVRYDPVRGEDKMTKLSQVPLFNKYNPGLTRDVGYNAQTFNPLKYDLPFFDKIEHAYRIDGTDYILFIDKVK